jgi:hypothetical protein
MFRLRPLRGALLATAACASLLVISERPAAADPGPFACQPGLFQVIAGQLKLLDPVAGAYTDIGAAGPWYNAMGYNVLDDHLYAIGTQNGVNLSQLLRIADDGSITSLGIPTGLPATGFVSGDMDDQGHLVVRASSTLLYSIDVMATPPVATPITLTSGTVDGSDLVWINGALYAAVGSTLSRVDLASNTADTVTVSGLPAGSYGAAWSDNPDHLFVSNNLTGVVYQITGYTGSSPSATARVTATVTSNNDGAACKQAADPFVAPTAADDAYVAVSGRTSTVGAAGGVLANDTGTDLTVATTTTTTNGTLVLQADGSFTYTPTGTFTGTDSFTYTAVDRFGRSSGTATVTITVELPPAPSAGDVAVSTPAGTPLEFGQDQVIRRTLGTGVTLTSWSQPAHGTVEILADGTVRYTPDPGFAGDDSFTYTVTDRYGRTATATVTLQVHGDAVDAPPATLAFTGRDAGELLRTALVLIGTGGLALLGATRLRRRPVVS